MTGPSTVTLFCVLAVVVFQGLLLRWAYAHFKTRHSIEDLKMRFDADIRKRAGQGLFPDWSFYKAETEALFDKQNERLRTFSAVALALGLGSTILSLVASLVATYLISSDLEPKELIQGTGLSLCGSLVGVLSHLIIVCFIHKFEDRFFGVRKDLFRDLLATAEATPPNSSSSLVDALKGELVHIRQSLTTEVAGALAEAVKGFPKVVQELGGNVSKLSEVVEGQGASIERAAGALVICANTVATAGEKLLPIGEGLASSAKMLGNLPDSLAATMKESREGWFSALSEQYERSWQELIKLKRDSEALGQERDEKTAALIVQLNDGILDLRQSLDQARANLMKDVVDLAERLGLAFGREARDVLNDASAQRQAEHTQFLERVEQHEQVWRNEIGTVVSEAFGKVEEQFRVGVVEKLSTATESIQLAVNTLPKAVEELERSHDSWLASHSKGLDAWRDAADSIQSAAVNLSEVDGVMRRAVAALGEGVDQAEKALRLQEGLKSELADALAAGTQQHLQELRSLHEKLTSIFQEAAKRSAQYEEKSEKILLSQAEIIERSLAFLTQGGSQLN